MGIECRVIVTNVKFNSFIESIKMLDPLFRFLLENGEDLGLSSQFYFTKYIIQTKYGNIVTETDMIR